MTLRQRLVTLLLLAPSPVWAQDAASAGAALSLAAALMLGVACLLIGAWAWVKQQGFQRRLDAEAKERHKHRQALATLMKVLTPSKAEPTPVAQLVGLAQGLAASARSPEEAAKLQALQQLALDLEMHLAEAIDQTEGARALVLRPEPLDLAQQMEWLVARWSRFSGASKLNLRLATQLPLVQADGIRLRQVLHGLLEAALKTSPQEVNFHAEPAGSAMRIGILVEGAKFTPGPVGQMQEQRVAQMGGRLVQEVGAGGFAWAFELPLAPAGTQLAAAVAPLPPALSATAPAPVSATAPAPVSASPPALPTPPLPSLGLDPLPALRLPPDMAQAFAQGKGAKVMVIDDEPANLVLISKYLEKEGFVLQCVESAVQALEMLEDSLPDVILLDLMMPHMSGYEFCAKVRQYHDPVQLPILMVTARNQPEDLTQGLQAGANDYITKPFNRMELVARVRGQLRLRELGKDREALLARRLAEHDLAEAKTRLSQMMDHSQNGMLFLNGQGAVTYLNRVAEQIFSQPKETLLGKPLSELADLPDGFALAGNQEFAAKLANSEKEIYLNLNAMEDDNGLAYACLVSESLLIRAGDFFQPHQDHHLHRLQQVCRDVLALARRESSSVSDCVTHLSRSLAEVHGEIQLAEFRNMLVKLMNQTLETWEKATGKGKVDLAESSGIWRAYLDGGVFRTRTLDKYFSLETLPNNPRWKDVADTAAFVLEQKNLPHPDSQALLETLNQLRRLQHT